MYKAKILGKAQEEYEENYTKSHNNLSFILHDKEKKSQNRQKKITYGRTIITVIKDFLAEIMRFWKDCHRVFEVQKKKKKRKEKNSTYNSIPRKNIFQTWRWKPLPADLY